MQSFQERVLGEIAKRAKDAGYEVSQSADYSNTGALNVHAEGTIRPWLQVRYDFQSSGYTLSMKADGKGIPSQEARKDYFDFCQANEQETAFWSVLSRTLKRGF